MYADYTFYLNEFKGTATEETFSRLSVIAKAHIDRITSNKAATAEGDNLTAVQLAFCAVVDELEKQEQGGIITSESNDGISRSYATGSIVKSSTQRIYAAAEVFLGNTNLLFVGV